MYEQMKNEFLMQLTTRCNFTTEEMKSIIYLNYYYIPYYRLKSNVVGYENLKPHGVLTISKYLTKCTIGIEYRKIQKQNIC